MTVGAIRSLEWRGEGAVVAREWRPRHYSGPMEAVHPDSFEICLVEDGCEHVVHERRRFTSSAGQYSLVPAHHRHSSWTERVPCRQTIVHVPRATVEDALRDAGAPIDGWGVSAPSATPPDLAAL